jgi:LCP family protein required for cell wall assembly
MSSRRHGGRPRRTWPQRLLILFNSMCVIVALAGAGTLAYAKKTVSTIPRTRIGQGALKSADSLPPGEPENFLIVGIDSDEGLAPDDPIRSGRDSGPEAASGLRSDTIMVVRVDPKGDDARILSFPRDLWVDIPGSGRNRINASLTYGDGTPTLLIQTIKANFGIDINHYVSINFAGFKNLVKLVGGVPVWFDTPVRDSKSGLNVENGGCTTLDENGAIYYVRSRHLRYRDADGDWVSDPTSDIGRVARQQDFIRRVIRRAISKGARNPNTLRGLIDTGSRNIGLDQVTTAGDLITLGKAFRNFDPDELGTYSLPVVDVVRGGAAVLDLVEGEAQPTLDLFRGTGSAAGAAAPTPGTVTVRVVNGTGKQNQAADTSQVFADLGFKTSTPGSGPNVYRTEVRYRPGQEAQAILVARYLATDPALVPDPDALDLTVVTGPDLFVRTDPRPESEVTTTTAPTTTTTLPGGTGGSTTTAPSPSGGTPPTTTVPKGSYLPGDPPPGQSCG